MTKTPQTEADELVEMFKSCRVEIFTRMDSIPCVLSDFLTTKSSTQLAIIHVERLIEAMNELLKDYPIGKVYHYHQHYQQVLEILKSKN